MSSWYKSVTFYSKKPFHVQLESFGEPSVSHQTHQEALKKCKDTFEKKQNELVKTYQKNLQTLTEKIEHANEALLNELQQQLPSFLLKLLEYIIPKVQITKETLQEFIQPLLQKGQEDEKIILHYSQQDEKLIQELKENFTSSTITWTLNTTLTSGDIMIETPSGTLDNRLQSRLQTLKERWTHSV